MLRLWTHFREALLRAATPPPPRNREACIIGARQVRWARRAAIANTFAYAYTGVRSEGGLSKGHRAMATKPAQQLLLVVEDNAATREALAGFLRHAGYTVIGAANGQEALNCLKGETLPDLI